MPTPNLEELDAVIAFLKAHPTIHDQGNWAQYNGNVPPKVTPALDCGSAFCIAGAVVARAGGIIQWTRSWEDFWSASEVIVDGANRWIESYAREVLGLTEDQSDMLFSGSNTMEDIDWIRDQIAEGVEDIDYDELPSNR